MPYVPSEKTDGMSQDRNLIDVSVDALALDIVQKIKTNSDMLRLYKIVFSDIGTALAAFNTGERLINIENPEALSFANTIFATGSNYHYWGAFLGELNYGITRLIQRVPQLMVETKQWLPKDELRYWAYACTVQALVFSSNLFVGDDSGIGGVFEDIKDEYKVRVNIGYEMAQIEKSGDCYDTPYYNRVVEILDETGKCVGKIYANMVRSEGTLHVDKLPFAIPARTLVHTAVSK